MIKSANTVENKVQTYDILVRKMRMKNINSTHLEHFIRIFPKSVRRDMRKLKTEMIT